MPILRRRNSFVSMLLITDLTPLWPLCFKLIYYFTAQKNKQIFLLSPRYLIFLYILLSTASFFDFHLPKRIV